jgi:hypothetical protein
MVVLLGSEASESRSGGGIPKENLLTVFDVSKGGVFFLFELLFDAPLSGAL